MIAETTINLYPIVKILSITGIVAIIVFLLHSGITLLKSLKLFSKHDNSFLDKFLNKYPDVTPDFMQKGLREQNIDNNQELHELEKRVLHLEKYVEDMNSKIQAQLDAILKEFENRG